MKTLYILRHAKSSWAEPGLADFDRPLNARGKRAAELIGAYIKKQGEAPHLILSSPAVRARETIETVLKTAKLTAELRYDQRIYEASKLLLVEVIAQIEEDLSSVLLVGHNPGMEGVLEVLTGRTETMATGTIAKVHLKPGKWSKAVEAQGELEWLVKPRELEGDSK